MINNLLLKAEELIQSKDYENAGKMIVEILLKEPNNTYALNDYAVLNILKDEYSIAEKIIEHVLEIDPSNEIAKENNEIINGLKSSENILLEKASSEAVKKVSSKPSKNTYNNKSLKEVIVYDPNWSQETFQSFYMDRETHRLKPNIVVLMPPEMEILFQINNFGFKGSDIDFSKKLVAVWGDSCVFGYYGKGWVESLDDYFKDVQFINGGVLGDVFPNICNRALESNRIFEISHNVIYPGWHTRHQPELIYSLLVKMIRELPGPILCTVPISIGEKLASIDLSQYFERKNLPGSKTLSIDVNYSFAGSTPYSIQAAQLIVKEFHKMNDIIRNVAHEYNVQLIDLHKEFFVDDLEHFRDDFFDIGHPRPKAYPKWQKIFYTELKDVLLV